jgi:hypothetical protein
MNQSCRLALLGLLCLLPATAPAQELYGRPAWGQTPGISTARPAPAARRPAAWRRPPGVLTARPAARRQAAWRVAHWRAPRHRPVKINERAQAERDGFKKVSDLVNFPPFFPGIGIVYVKPDTLPHGPFLAFDRKNRLIETLYMVPLDEMRDHKPLDFTKLRKPSDHVTMYFNAGHAGVDMPHYHVVIWHVPKDQEKVVAK